jgi:hypothetical protein
MTESEQGTPDAEVPVEDALEQRAEVVEADDTATEGDIDDPGEADPADRAEQGQVVDLGDDEYPDDDEYR